MSTWFEGGVAVTEGGPAWATGVVLTDEAYAAIRGAMAAAAKAGWPLGAGGAGLPGDANAVFTTNTTGGGGGTGVPTPPAPTAPPPIITEPGQFSTADVATNLRGVTDPAQKVAIIRSYLEALKAQREALGKRLDVELGMTREGGIVFAGPARGQMEPVDAAGNVIRNVLYVHPDGTVYNLTLAGVGNVSFRATIPIVDVDLTLGQAIAIPH